MPEGSEFSHFMDFYWGGRERRITGITLRIIAVNALALLMLIFGILYLGEFKKNVINARLETFQSRLELIADALAENIAIQKNDPRSQARFRVITKRLSQTAGEHVLVFDTQGHIVADSDKIPDSPEREAKPSGVQNTEPLRSIEILKTAFDFVTGFLPDQKVLPEYPEILSEDGSSYPDVLSAIHGTLSISVWQKENQKIFLSAAAPLHKGQKNYGAVLLTKEAQEIEADLVKIWRDVLKFFGLTLVMTVVLSIYLSGVIARPLKKLARAAEDVRKGQASAEDIPDLSYRFDEIGELSIVLRQMTRALWDRMDSIENFAADVAHELKNPLTSLRSAVEAVKIIKKQEDRERLLAVIAQDVDRLDRLITDISMASRLDSELSREAPERVDLGALLHHVLSLYENPLSRKIVQDTAWDRTVDAGSCRITLQRDHKRDSEKGVFVWGLENRLGQVFQNIISNARSFSPEKGHIAIQVIPRRHTVEVLIQDEGPGIPETKKEAIFERFYSERPKHEDYGFHSGLGLSICRQIVEAHNGEIFAENMKDPQGKVLGARFTVILKRC